MSDLEPDLWTSAELERRAEPAPEAQEPGRSPWLRRLVLLVLVAVWVFVLFTEIFPRLEPLIQDPSIEESGVAAPAAS